MKMVEIHENYKKHKPRALLRKLVILIFSVLIIGIAGIRFIKNRTSSETEKRIEKDRIWLDLQFDRLKKLRKKNKGECLNDLETVLRGLGDNSIITADTKIYVNEKIVKCIKG
jgi:hypothetical protein